MVTALLGIGSFALQGKLAKDAEVSQKVLESTLVEWEKERLAVFVL
jgi:hypothetical protein